MARPLAAALVTILAPAVTAFAQQGPPVPAPGDEPPAAATKQPATKQAPAKEAPAKDAPAPANADAPAKPTATFTLFADHVFSSDFDGAPGSVSVTRLGGALEADFPMGERRGIDLSFGAMHSWYDFKDATGFVSGSDKPWENVTELGVRLGYHAPINDRWGFLVSGNVVASFENNADFNDSVTYAGTGGVTYSFSPKATVGFALTVSSRLEDSAIVVPVPIIRWQFAERWSLSSYGNPRGAGLALAYQPCDTWTIALRAGFDAHEFRLDDAGPSAGGVGRVWRIPVEVMASWKVASQVTLSASVGLEGWQRYTLDNATGDELGEFDANAAFVVGVGAEFTF